MPYDLPKKYISWSYGMSSRALNFLLYEKCVIPIRTFVWVNNCYTITSIFDTIKIFL